MRLFASALWAGLRRLLLGLGLIALFSAILLLSDLGHRRTASASARRGTTGRKVRAAIVYYAPSAGNDLCVQGLIDGLRAGGFEEGNNLEILPATQKPSSAGVAPEAVESIRRLPETPASTCVAPKSAPYFKPAFCKPSMNRSTSSFSESHFSITLRIRPSSRNSVAHLRSDAMAGAAPVGGPTFRRPLQSPRTSSYSRDCLSSWQPAKLLRTRLCDSDSETRRCDTSRGDAGLGPPPFAAWPHRVPNLRRMQASFR